MKDKSKKHGYQVVNTTQVKIKEKNRLPMYDDEHPETINKPIYNYQVENVPQQMRNDRINEDMDKLANLSKLVYIMLTIMPTYADSLKRVYNDMVSLGMKADKLGTFNDCLKAMFRAEEEYNYAHKKLMELWDFTNHKDDILNFIQHSYNSITDIVESSCKVNADGKDINNGKTLLIVDADAVDFVTNSYDKYIKERDLKSIG